MEFIAKEFNELKPNELYEILKSRTEVFLLEQRIVCQDMDDVDYDSLHLFLWENNRVIAYLRLFRIENNNLKIGRVLSIEHKKGLGRILMENTLKYIKDKISFHNIYLDAQVQAIGYYEKFGFKVISEEFLDEEISHKKMIL